MRPKTRVQVIPYLHMSESHNISKENVSWGHSLKKVWFRGTQKGSRRVLRSLPPLAFPRFCFLVGRRYERSRQTEGLW